MKRASKSLVLLLTVTVLAFAGCQNKENAAASGSAAPAPQATADPHPPIGILDTPREGAAVANKSWGTGWALDDSGIAQVTATADNGAVSPAKIGQAFPGVKEAYPNVTDNDKAGFIFGVPDLPPGPHTLKVEIVAKDGGKAVLIEELRCASRPAASDEDGEVGLDGA